MALPVGVTSALAHIDAPVSFGGTPAKVYLEVVPNIRLNHIATGTPLANFIDVRTPGLGEPATVTLPHTDQAGFQDESGLPVTNWSYAATIRYELDGQLIHVPVKHFQLLTGQTDIDLALLPVGEPAEIILGNVAFVSSVNGRSGAVALDKTDVGLTNVDNTSDANKPVSTAQQAALNTKITAFADPGADRLVFWDDSASEFAPLQLSGGLSLSGTLLSIPASSETFAGRVELATDAETATGTDNTRAVHPAGLKPLLDAKAPLASPTFTGTVGGITKSMVGLGNVDNTSDLNKPVSTATQSAITALDSRFERILGVRGVTRTVYVRATGNDANDGSSVALAFREIRTAVTTVLESMGPVNRGTIVFDVGAGTYKGGITFPRTRGRAQDELIKIVGPGASNAVPTVIIDKAADATATYGISAFDGASIWIENLKFTGGFENHEDYRRYVYVVRRNIHLDGTNTATNGLAIMQYCAWTNLGGIVENFLGVGVQEHFHVHRSLDGATSAAESMLIQNCDTGFQAKENCVGHLDYLTVQDCDTGVELNGACVANVKGMVLKRNTSPLVVVNSEIHNSDGLVWGTGADVNTRGIQILGHSGSDLSRIGWVDGTFPRTQIHGYAPLITTAISVTDSTVTGTTTETNFYNLTGAIKHHRYITQGQKFTVKCWGKVNGTAIAAPYRILLRIAGQQCCEVSIPTGTAANARFQLEFEVICSTTGNTQKTFGKITGEGSNFADFHQVNRTLTLDTVDSGVAISAIPGNTADSVTLHTCEVWG